MSRADRFDRMENPAPIPAADPPATKWQRCPSCITPYACSYAKKCQRR